MTHLKVAVRVRPLSEREVDLNSTSIVNVNDTSIDVTNLKVHVENAGDSRQRVRRFTFDHCFQPQSTQQQIFDVIGKEIEEALKNKYHSCVLAYGQSSTGKTHTMMGTPSEPGLTPRICKNIFSYFPKTENLDQNSDNKITISYLEIYNEKVRDLLVSQDDWNRGLKVRQHPKKGPYVQGLSEHEVNDPETLVQLLNFGNSNRSVAATLTNPCSSRSHSVFTFNFIGGVQLHLVDLAGSERVGSHSFLSASVLKEGANINKSLVALGNVISTLADNSTKFSRRKRFVPFRDSILTWLLKDTLGGNSRTILIATVSPSSACYSETVNTLRFGQRAKQIVSQPLVNEDPKEKTIRELKDEIAKLRQLLSFEQTPQTNIRSVETTDAFTDSRDLIEEISVKSDGDIFINLVEKSESHSITSRHQIFNDNEDPSRTRQEELIPLITVNACVENAKEPSLKKPKLIKPSIINVNHSKMEKKKSKSLGSQELLSKPAEKSKKLPPHRRPLDKTQSLSKVSLRKSQESIAKLDVSKKSTAAPRKDIIASVTNRLYASIKKKEQSTSETQQNNTSSPSPVANLQQQQLAQNEESHPSSSGGKMKLLELTRKALKAHRRRNVDVQTDLNVTTRVKDVSTDVEDLPIKLSEIRDASTEMDVVTSADVAVYCSPQLDSFDFNGDNSNNNSLILTRSCGTQSMDFGNDQERTKSGPISFTKYLQNSTETFTSSLNIDLGKRLLANDNTSEDSLDDLNPLQVCFPTPDLISNHNSLETHAQQADFAKNDESNKQTPLFHLFNENFAVVSESCVANCSVTTSDAKNKIQAVKVTTLYSPEVCINKDLPNESVRPLKQDDDVIPEVVKPAVTEVVNDLKRASVKSTEILKSIMKFDKPEGVEDSLLGSDDMDCSRVRFTNRNNSSKTERKVLDTMTRFLEEAAKLMTNLTLVASSLESTSKSFDVHVTVTDPTEPPIPSTSSTSSSRPNRRKGLKRRLNNTSTQTCQNTENAGVQTSDNDESSFFNFHNRYESILKESCNRLEHCINVALEKSNNGRRRLATSIEREEVLHRFPQPFTCHPAEWNVRNLAMEDSSLESNPTFSDYGSLPRQKQAKRSMPSGSPSAYLKQLMRIRRQIVEASRENLMYEAKEDSF